MRMIERWFPCSEVSTASAGGWGSGKSERTLFTWFAARPLAQAKAAVLTSLLPWPDEPDEQKRLKALVRRALTGRDEAWAELRDEIAKSHPDGASTLDPFSGRALIPLEAARLGLRSIGIDYSPVATLAGRLLADYPLRDWSGEPALPFVGEVAGIDDSRLLRDIETTLREIGARFEQHMDAVYPKVDGRRPWGYLWAVAIPCLECNRRFPLTGSFVLRHPLPQKDDLGQSYQIIADRKNGTFRAEVHNGPPFGRPPLSLPAGRTKGKVATCPFCEHVHETATHSRMTDEGLGEDKLLVVADLDDIVGKLFREPTVAELAAADSTSELLARAKPFPNGLAAVPTEPIPDGNRHTVRASMYGARTYGDMCCARQTLGLVELCRIVDEIGVELREAGLSTAYAEALVGYACSVVVRKIRRSTRGATLDPNKRPESNRVMIGHVFQNEASVSFSYDYFETGISDGPGTWNSLLGDTLAVMRHQVRRTGGSPARIDRGSALSLPLRARSISAVVTDPPYDQMIDYSDASDLFYVWLKRALASTDIGFAMTAHPLGVQEKDEEVIVKDFAAKDPEAKDHRDQDHFDRSLAQAFGEAQRVVVADGVVTIVFGHGDPDVWHRLLGAIRDAGLVLTGSWPAKTEGGGSAGSANIVTTITMACRPAPDGRPEGRRSAVEQEVRREVQNRIPMWQDDGLAQADQLMAAHGPAMEVYGRYSRVIDHLGNEVDHQLFLLVARRAVEDSAAVEIDHLPIQTFDARTRFALGWVRVYGKAVAPKSDARWQLLSADLPRSVTAGVLKDSKKGTRFASAADHKTSEIDAESSIIDLAWALARAWPNGLDDVGDEIHRSGRSADDQYLWAAFKYLCAHLPEADPDAAAWTALMRNRRAVVTAVRGQSAQIIEIARERAAKEAQGQLFESQVEG
jgi:putative DNA methylase